MLDYLTSRSAERSNESINTKNCIALPLGCKISCKTSAYKHKNGKRSKKTTRLSPRERPKEYRHEKPVSDRDFESPAACQVCLIVRNPKKKKRKEKRERNAKEIEKNPRFVQADRRFMMTRWRSRK
ncbi:hypothetical protein AVEN_253210-1 [Araneus ventricosus]|uniref:Uncharacterized protein n=1 Tax=Araneus ventricosus TaxID=182803 RepID=A0A4Y2R4Y3_ARAVE|nr:hypothetical protein AVEN_61804-1 [Araneus ventricosus]GBN70767.1 hypothetical protein AVEN_253210-1 [Araneus ventricosus]